MCYEPHMALFAGATGLEAIDCWLKKVMQFLKQGHFLFEIGHDQYLPVKKKLKNYFKIRSFHFHSDLSGIKRVVHCMVN